MLRIRLRRVGKKKQPSYRIVVADSRKPRDGAFVETLGHYHPLDNPSTIVIDADRARHWLDRGAQPSDRVAKLLAIQGIAEIPAKLKTRIELGNQRAKEAAKEEEAPAAEAAAPETAAEAKAEAPTAEPKAPAAAADEAPAEAEAEAPPAEAKADPDQEKPAAEEEKPAAGEASKDEKPAADDAAGDGEEQTKE